MDSIHSPYSPTILKNVPCLILKDFMSLKVKTFTWLNQTIEPIRDCVTVKF